MNKLNNEYISILSKDENPAKKFWEVDKRIKQDKRSPGVLIDMRKSRFMENILCLLRDEVIQLNDLDEFGELFKESLDLYMKFYKK